MYVRHREYMRHRHSFQRVISSQAIFSARIYAYSAGITVSE